MRFKEGDMVWIVKNVDYTTRSIRGPFEIISINRNWYHLEGYKKRMQSNLYPSKKTALMKVRSNIQRMLTWLQGNLEIVDSEIIGGESNGNKLQG